MSNIGRDNDDRKIGEYWEDVFCSMARKRGWEAYPFQRQRGATFKDTSGRIYICPDVWLLKRGDTQLACEIKHKTPAQNNCYGFELYREESLLRLQGDYSNQFGGVTSLYIVHNWALNGDKRSHANNNNHWVAQRLDVLSRSKHMGKSKTYFGGRVTDEEVPICYYPVACFVGLMSLI